MICHSEIDGLASIRNTNHTHEEPVRGGATSYSHLFTRACCLLSLPSAFNIRMNLIISVFVTKQAIHYNQKYSLLTFLFVKAWRICMCVYNVKALRKYNFKGVWCKICYLLSNMFVAMPSYVWRYIIACLDHVTAHVTFILLIPTFLLSSDHGCFTGCILECPPVLDCLSKDVCFIPVKFICIILELRFPAI